MNKLSKILNKKINFPVWFIILAFFSLYISWEVYWFEKVGLQFIKLHTHLVFILFLFYIGLLFLIQLSKKIKYAEKIILVFSSIMATLFIVELFFHFFDFNKTYMEKRSDIYQSAFKDMGSDKIRARGKNQEHKLKSPEFDYARITNSYGFSDFEFTKKNVGSEILIQTYGDSFTEGDGAPFDSSYPALMRSYFDIKNRNIAIQNFGICGNDPGFYPYQIKDVGLKFKPDILILCYGTGDFLVDFYTRGGLERFNDKGWKGVDGPWWEFIYALNYFSRQLFHVFGYNYSSFFTSKEEYKNQLKLLENKWVEVFKEIEKITKSNDVKVLLIKKPEKSEIILKEYQYDFAFFDDYILKNRFFKHYDLMNYYIDSAKFDNTNIDLYYWEKDGHHNSKGYQIMAEGVIDALYQNFDF
jgi:lysophospholipase L1-like esterase